ncbi:unnamed protein product, partial [Didymodactylos carnosus]
ESSTISYPIDWTDEDGLNKNFHAEYLQEFIETFYRRIVELIDRGVAQQKRLATNRVYTEILINLIECLKRDNPFMIRHVVYV